MQESVNSFPTYNEYIGVIYNLFGCLKEEIAARLKFPN